MNNDQFAGRWEQLKGRIRLEFAELTDDDMAQIQGQKQRLVGRIRQRYGDARKAALQKLNALLEEANEALS